MKLCYSPDEITATKGDLMEFRRYINTDDCEANQIQTHRQVGDRWTFDLEPCVFISVLIAVYPLLQIYRRCRFTAVIFLHSIHNSTLEKTIRNLWNEHGCRILLERRDCGPFRPDVIVERVREFLREDRLMFYYVLNQNCEHFATSRVVE
jgi:hypothetical protein